MFTTLLIAACLCSDPSPQDAWRAEQARREVLVRQHKAEWQARWRAYPIHNQASDNLAAVQARDAAEAQWRLYNPWRRWRY